MAKGVRFKRYSRRVSSVKGRSGAAVMIISAAVFVILCLVISVAVGIALGKRADEYNSSKQYDIAAEEYYSGDKKVRAVDAYVFFEDSNVRSYISSGITDFSVCLRRADGELTFSSSLAPVPEGERKASFESLAENIHAYDGYICAYFYVDSFAIEDPYLRKLNMAYEIALVNEAVRCGADEIMLVGLDVNSENIDEVQGYVSEMSFAAENSLLGVLVSPELFALSDDGLYYAARIRSVCDFIALDLREVGAIDEENEENEENEDNSADGTEEPSSEFETLISEMEYYLKSYNMRLVFSRSNSALYDEAKALGATSIQIIED